LLRLGVLGGFWNVGSSGGGVGGSVIPVAIINCFVIKLRVVNHLFAKQLMCRLLLTATGCVRCANAYDGVHVLERQLLYVERTNKPKIAFT
jgi:hypothetical protein